MHKKYVLILLLVTLIVRGVLFLSYPLGGLDDNQASQSYMIGEVASGNLLIGNLRFNTGYPLVIAPIVWLSRFFIPLDDRLWLLVQIGLSSLIPFMIFDMLRKRRSPKEALVVALFVAVDPFGLQWAHTVLPTWLVALCLTLGLWLIDRGLHSSQPLRWTALAGIVFGIGVLGRVNVAPAVAAVGLMCLILHSRPWRVRFRMFATLGLVAGGVLALYMVTIHYPSTGTWKLSTISGHNLLQIPHKLIDEDNGPATRRLIALASLPALRETLFLVDTYPLWQKPGPWVPAEEQAAFLEQSTRPQEAFTYLWPSALYYYLGPVETDELLHQVFFELVAAHPIEWLKTVLTGNFHMFVQTEHGFNPMYLPRYSDIALATSANNVLGFQRTVMGDYYTGQWVWVPGIWLFSLVFDPFGLLKWLTIPAFVWTLWSREWLYRTGALMALACYGLLIIYHGEPRTYAPVYPFVDMVIGGLLAAGLRRLYQLRSLRQSAQQMKET